MEASIQFIVSTVVVLTTIGIGLTFSGFVGIAGGEQSDQDQINKLVQKIKDKCEGATAARPAPVSTSHRIELNVYERISYNPETSKLIAEKSDDSIDYEMEGCEYQFEGFPVEKDERTVWNFDISIEDGSTYPPVIKVDTTQ